MGTSIGQQVDIAKEQRDAQLNQEIARVQAEGAQEQALADTEGQAEIARAQQFAGSQQPFTEPTPQDHIEGIMQGAPWIMALAALGGAAGKLSGQAMMDGLNGVSEGLLKGDQEGMQNAWNKYDAEYQKWKTRSDQQFKIYSVLEDAYGKSADGRMRAMHAAHAMTNDLYAAKMQADDPMTLLKLRSELELNHARAAEAFAKAKQAGAGASDRIRSLKAAIYAAGLALPSSRGSNIDQVVQGLIDRNPTATDDEIVQGIRKNKLQIAGDTTAVRAAGTIAGRTGVALEEAGPFGNNVIESATALDRGSFVPVNKLLNMRDESIQNSALRQLKIDINEFMNTYDVVAGRGGSDKDKREVARNLLLASDSVETLEVAVARMQKIAAQAQGAATSFIERRAAGGAPPSGGSDTAPRKRISLDQLPP